MSVLSTTVTIQLAGIPMESTMANLLQQASASSEEVQAAYGAWYGISNLFEAAASDEIPWISSSTEPGGYPVLYIQQGLSDNMNAAILTLFPFEEVMNGSKIPEKYVYEDTEYLEIGSVLLSVKIANNVAYVVMMRVGVAADSSFEGVDWQSSLSPVLPTIANQIDKLFAPLSPTSSKTLELGIDEVVKVTQGVLIVLKVIQIVKEIYTIIEHPSTFQTLMINPGNSAIAFKDYYLEDAGEKFYGNTLGQEIKDLSSCVLPAPATTILPDGSSLTLIQLISGKQVSKRNLEGTGLAFTYHNDALDTAAALINIPFASANKIAAQANYTNSAEDFWDANSGADSALSLQITLSDNSTLNMAIDALSGKQPSENGYLAYFYNTVISFNS